MRRKVHLRPAQVVNLGSTQTYCGRTLYSAPQDMSGAVVNFGTAQNDIDVTVRGALVTCGRCLDAIHARAAMTDLLKLAERCEQATGSDRELDVAILTQVLGYRDIFEDGSLYDRDNDGYWSLEGDEKNAPLPSPTSSLDAAMTLVPEGHEWLRKSPGTMTVYRIPEHPKGWAKHDEVRGATPALALTAACLRARAAMEKNNG